MRIAPLTEDQIAWCKRLHEFRLALRITRTGFGKIIGMDSTTLASKEYARVPWSEDQIYNVWETFADFLVGCGGAFQKTFSRIPKKPVPGGYPKLALALNIKLEKSCNS